MSYRVWLETGDLLAYGLSESGAADLVDALNAHCALTMCESSECGVMSLHGFSEQEADDDGTQYGEWGQYPTLEAFIKDLQNDVDASLTTTK